MCGMKVLSQGCVELYKSITRLFVLVCVHGWQHILVRIVVQDCLDAHSHGNQLFHLPVLQCRVIQELLAGFHQGQRQVSHLRSLPFQTWELACFSSVHSEFEIGQPAGSVVGVILYFPYKHTPTYSQTKATPEIANCYVVFTKSHMYSPIKHVSQALH